MNQEQRNAFLKKISRPEFLRVNVVFTGPNGWRFCIGHSEKFFTSDSLDIVTLRLETIRNSDLYRFITDGLANGTVKVELEFFHAFTLETITLPPLQEAKPLVLPPHVKRTPCCGFSEPT